MVLIRKMTELGWIRAAARYVAIFLSRYTTYMGYGDRTAIDGKVRKVIQQAQLVFTLMRWDTACTYTVNYRPPSNPSK